MKLLPFYHQHAGSNQTAGDTPDEACPGVKFSATPAGVRTLPENLGESSVSVLQELGYDDSAIAAMVESGATVDGTTDVKSEAAE
jgi:crotonobetainyl-CoA:carnitine CoA-transferase CaiB-like acyl-CoA transferase